MKRYAVAYLSFFENVMNIKVVEAENEIEACKSFVSAADLDTLESVEDYAANCDSAITALEIPDTGSAERLA
jgi:hypothetical protein